MVMMMVMVVTVVLGTTAPMSLNIHLSGTAVLLLAVAVVERRHRCAVVQTGHAHREPFRNVVTHLGIAIALRATLATAKAHKTQHLECAFAEAFVQPAVDERL